MSAPLTPDATDATVWSGLRIALHRGLGHAVNIRLSSREQEDRMRRAWVELDKLRERLERAEQSERDLSDVMGLLQRRLQPDGSPPAGTVVTLADWITQSALLRITENEKDAKRWQVVRDVLLRGMKRGELEWLQPFEFWEDRGVKYPSPADLDAAVDAHAEQS